MRLMSEIHIDAHVRAPHRVLYSAQSLLTFVIILLAGASVLLAQEDVWSGFRGQLRQGKSATQLQTLTWSANDNVLWKTPLPGLGLSSPIVKGDKVFVTTSYPTTTAAWVTRAVAILRLVLCTGLFAAVIIITVNDPRVSAVGDFLRATVLLFCTSALMILAIYDANLFDYARCPIRTWIGTSMSVNLCLVIAACLVRGRMWLKWSTLAAAVAFAFILYTGVPDRDHVMSNVSRFTFQSELDGICRRRNSASDDRRSFAVSLYGYEEVGLVSIRSGVPGGGPGGRRSRGSGSASIERPCCPGVGTPCCCSEFSLLGLSSFERTACPNASG